MIARLSLAVPLALAAGALGALPASAADPVLLRAHARASATGGTSCIEARRSGPAVATRHLTAPRGGYLTARLQGGGARSDWDLAVFARGEREPVAASAYRGSREVAGGFVKRGDRLTVQACRLSGPARDVRLTVDLQRVKHPHLKLVRVAAEPETLGGLGVDATDHTGPGFTDVILHGRRDAATLRRAHLSFHRVKPSPPARAARVHALLPSGHMTSYRQLAEYSSEMKALAQQNPGLVKPFTLAHPSWQGRPIEGIEVTSDVSARDGKPVLLMLGLHHAREWPSGELTLEFAYELVKDFKAGQARTVDLLSHARVIFVPVTNPDGFNFSRTDGQTNGHGQGTTGFDPSKPEDHRKNCHGGTCVVSQGVDINRNYGDRWGGEGGTDSPTGETYRGTAPFSEPEAQDIRELISSNQVTTMITNHTFANDILRQPGAEDDFPTPDETIYKQLSDDMAGAAGYASIVSYQLYAPNDHVGTTDGWSYFTTGGLGYVIEAMPDAFHPPFGQVTQHYETGSGSGGSAEGLRESFFLALESTANTARHSVIRGSAPAGSVLRLTKSFQNRTSLGPPTDEHFETTLDVPASGQFEWHVNPSGRPLAPDEQWTLTCERPEGTVLATRQVSVARAQSVTLDLSDCVPPVPPPPTKITPTIKLLLTPKYRKPWYRVRVKGALEGVDPGPRAERCAGSVKLTILAKGKRVRTRTTAVDAGCGFGESFRFKRSALPKSLRRHGAHRLRAVAHWNGNDFVEAAERSVSAGVQRRARH